MKLALHLISMPWSPIDTPSIQTGALKAHIDRKHGPAVVTRTYSPFFSIFAHVAHRAKKNPIDFFEALSGYGEYIYMLLYARRFGLGGKKLGAKDLSALVKTLSSSELAKPKLTIKLLDDFEAATDRFIETELAPALSRGTHHLVGFTLNFDQVYSSFFCAQTLLAKRLRNDDLTFVFGGASAALPEVFSLAKTLGIGSYFVAGEGEKKIELFVRALLLGANPKKSAPGITHSLEDDPQIELPKAVFETQFSSLEKLPLPEYEEYFETFFKNVPTKREQKQLLPRIALSLEGSRGCFAHCDFCGLNWQWKDFRKRSAEDVFAAARALVDRYGLEHLRFVDNVCDTWAEAYAELMLESGHRSKAFMELRAHHPEEFWEKLARSGVNRIQLGLEAISPPLLAKMAKGTKVVQNILAHKALTELGIRSCSNLISHHPKSTVADVEETMRVIELIPHLQPFGLSRFTLVTGSPIYAGVSRAEKRRLKPKLAAKLPPRLERHMIGFGFDLPDEMELDTRTSRAWDFFKGWYAPRQSRGPCGALEMRQRGHGQIEIKDQRGARAKKHALDALHAQVYRVCSRGLKAKDVAAEIGASEAQVARILDELVSARLMLKTEDYHLSLALRRKDGK